MKKGWDITGLEYSHDLMIKILSGKDRLKVIKNLEVFNVETNKYEKIGDI